MNALMIVLLLAVVLLGVTTMVLLSIKMGRKDQLPSDNAKGKSTANYQYQAKMSMMSRAEEGVFRKLVDLCEDQCYVVPQVHLSCLFAHEIRGQNWKAAFNHINGKSVDFVLLDQKSLKPLCAIELDDSSHNATDRQERDQEVERIFAVAKFPLVRLTQAMASSREKVGEAIMSAVNAPAKK